MAGVLLRSLFAGGGWLTLAGMGVYFVFQIWMCIDAIRRGEWMWAAFIWFFPGLGTIYYYFAVYRASSTRGFELPGAQNRWVFGINMRD